MKRSYEPTPSYIPYLPPEIYGYIRQFMSSESRANWCAVDKERRDMFSKLASSICIRPPTERLSSSPVSIYEDLIARYPHVQKIKFEPCSFDDRELSFEKRILAFIDFCKKSENHPLTHVKELNVRKLLSNDTNKAFLNALSNPGIESVIFRPHLALESLGREDIQPILTNSKGLKHFQIQGLITTFSIPISFKDLPELTSVIMAPDAYISPVTIKSLRRCTKLDSLSASYHAWIAPGVEQAFKNHTWNLKHLSLAFPFRSTTLSFIKQMPLLESLTLHCDFIPPNLKNLSAKCPNLKKLHVETSDQDDYQLAKTLQGFSNLETLIFISSSNPGETLLKSIGDNCPKLKLSKSKKISDTCTRWTYYETKL